MCRSKVETFFLKVGTRFSNSELLKGFALPLLQCHLTYYEYFYPTYAFQNDSRGIAQDDRRLLEDELVKNHNRWSTEAPISIVCCCLQSVTVCIMFDIL